MKSPDASTDISIDPKNTATVAGVGVETHTLGPRSSPRRRNPSRYRSREGIRFAKVIIHDSFCHRV